MQLLPHIQCVRNYYDLTFISFISRFSHIQGIYSLVKIFLSLYIFDKDFRPQEDQCRYAEYAKNITWKTFTN